MDVNYMCKGHAFLSALLPAHVDGGQQDTSSLRRTVKKLILMVSNHLAKVNEIVTISSS